MPLVEPGVEYPREVEVPGMPPGWKALERAYGETTTKAGCTYIRFDSIDGKHKQLTSVRLCYIQNAVDDGRGENAGQKDYTTWKDQVAQEKHELRPTGEDADGAAAAFRAKFGKLEPWVIPKIPGWTYKLKFVDTSNCAYITYYDPEGKPFSKVKLVEAVFGKMISRGEDMSFIDRARQDAIAEYGSLDPGFNPLRRGEGGVSITDLARNGELEKVREAENQSTVRASTVRSLISRSTSVTPVQQPPEKKVKVAAEPFEFAESEALAVISAASREGSVQQDFAAAGAPEAEALARTVADIRSMLSRRGFDGQLAMLVTFGRTPGGAALGAISGAYYEVGHLNGRPCFQWVGLHPTAEGGLGCRGCYVYWNSVMPRWQIGALVGQTGNDAACVAYNGEDVPNPGLLRKPWMLVTGGADVL